MNKVILMGNLAHSPKVTEVSTDKKVAKFDIAVNDGYGDNKETFFFHVCCWGKQAENCEKYLEKGNKVLVSGRLTERTYETKDGVKKSITEIIASEVEFLTMKSKDSNEEQTKAEMRPMDEPDVGLPF